MQAIKDLKLPSVDAQVKDAEKLKKESFEYLTEVERIASSLFSEERIKAMWSEASNRYHGKSHE